MEFDAFIKSMKNKLGEPLPGLPAQLKMASLRRLTKDGKIIVPDHVKKSAVLALFYPADGKICMVLIKRAEYPGVHSGQISFPGGRWEQGDQDMIETALREAEEEIGVRRETVVPIGVLTDLFIPPSNFLVTPVVGYISECPDFRPDQDEVDRILEIPLDEILDISNILEKDITIFPAVAVRVPCFYIGGNVIWGATAMMLSELIEVIRRGS